MGKHTNLRWNFPMLFDLLKAPQHFSHLFRAVGHRVQADDSIARAKRQALQRGRRDALRIIRGMIGLQAAGKRSRQADGGVAVGCDCDFVCRIDEVQVAHQLTDSRYHFGGQSSAELSDIRAGCFFAENPLPQV